MARKGTARTGKPFTASSSSSKPTSRPAKRPKRDTADAYTYEHALPRRRRTSEAQLSLSKEEAGPSERPGRGRAKRPAAGGEEDEDSADDMAERIRSIARRIAQDELEEHVESEESEVDSDEAFEESDEERWGDTFERLDKGKGKKGKSKAQEVVLKVSNPLLILEDLSDLHRSPLNPYA